MDFKTTIHGPKMDMDLSLYVEPGGYRQLEDGRLRIGFGPKTELIGSRDEFRQLFQAVASALYGWPECAPIIKLMMEFECDLPTMSARERLDATSFLDSVPNGSDAQ